MHPSEIIYNLGNKPTYGSIQGVCRITGKVSVGLYFKKWVKPTFNDQSYLRSGDIISNEALFTFDEASVEIQEKLNKDKPQRFRTYCHVVTSNSLWKCYTKANKKEILNDIAQGATLVCLTDTGQKHLLFKHRIGFWQLDENYIQPNVELLQEIHLILTKQLLLGFNQTAAITGDYQVHILSKLSKQEQQHWKENEDYLKIHRGTSFFDFTAWLLFNP